MNAVRCCVRDQDPLDPPTLCRIGHVRAEVLGEPLGALFNLRDRSMNGMGLRQDCATKAKAEVRQTTGIRRALRTSLGGTRSMLAAGVPGRGKNWLIKSDGK